DFHFEHVRRSIRHRELAQRLYVQLLWPGSPAAHHKRTVYSARHGLHDPPVSDRAWIFGVHDRILRIPAGEGIRHGLRCRLSDRWRTADRRSRDPAEEYHAISVVVLGRLELERRRYEHHDIEHLVGYIRHGAGFRYLHDLLLRQHGKRRQHSGSTDLRTDP